MGNHRDMPARRFSDEELAAKLEQGKSMSQIAREFEVNKGSVSRRVGKLNFGIAANVTLHHAGEVVKKQINILDRLVAQIEKTETMLGMGMAVIETPAERRDELLAGLGPLMGTNRPNVMDLVLKCQAECRQQIKLVVDIRDSLINQEQIAEFQAEVLETIGSLAPEIREGIVRRLAERSALRSTIGFH